MHTDTSTLRSLSHLLGRTAEQIVEHGTNSEPWTLTAMATAVRRTSPGAAAALVDWQGSEVARLRAYGVVHGVVLYELTPSAQAHLLAQIVDGADLAVAG